MFDTVIVGAGLTGLALADRLLAQGQSVRVFEARQRAGGRILTHMDESGAAIDLGATWYWPDTEPRMTKLVAALGLGSFDQPDQGKVLSLVDPNQGPTEMNVLGVHAGARRLRGGAVSLIEALLDKIGPDMVQQDHKLVAIKRQEGHVELQFALSDGTVARIDRVTARHVVLAIPPRLIAQHIRFEPALPQITRDALESVQTWMAREAKSIARFKSPYWHSQGCSGSAFVNHSQAALREVWDASDERGAALAGFSAIPPDARPAFARSMPLLVESQLTQLFGPEQEPVSQHTMDWATEPLTCSTFDLADPETVPPMASPLLRQAQWGGLLYFGSTETARQSAGHMEGALEAAAHLANFLRQPRAKAAREETNMDTVLSAFNAWVQQERDQALSRYRQHLNQLLSRQDNDRPTQRALLQTAEQVYAKALEHLADLDLSLPEAVSQSQHALTPQALKAFAGFNKMLVEEALKFNATSCALSNFPTEHKPDADYLRVITADLVAAWQEFALSTNDLLCARSAQAA
jgi:monoamine oxidase